MLRRLVIATFALPAFGGAQAQITRDIGALFQTDSLRYTLRATSWGLDGEIGVTFTNRTSGTVYIVNCKGATGVFLAVPRWRRARVREAASVYREVVSLPLLHAGRRGGTINEPRAAGAATWADS